MNVEYFCKNLLQDEKFNPRYKLILNEEELKNDLLIITGEIQGLYRGQHFDENNPIYYPKLVKMSRLELLRLISFDNLSVLNKVFLIEKMYPNLQLSYFPFLENKEYLYLYDKLVNRYIKYHFQIEKIKNIFGKFEQ